MSSTSLLDQTRTAMKPAVKELRSFDGLVRVISHYDADGITAAGIMARALINDGKRFRLSFVRGINEEVFRNLEHEGFIIVLDMGSGQIGAIKKMGAIVIICDHHITPELAGRTPSGSEEHGFQPIETEQGIVYEFNSHVFGIDGAYAACGASLCYALVTAINRMNSPTSAIALAGIFGDRQSQPLIGLNKDIVEEGIAQGYIQEKRNTLSLDGDTIREALTYSVDPYFPGLTGREAKVDEFLGECGIDGSKTQESLSLHQKRNLTNKLMLLHLKQNSPPEAIERMVGTRYFLSEFGQYADTLSNRLNACGRLDRMTTGVAACLCEGTALAMAGKLREKYMSKIRNGLVYLESRGIKKMDHIQYFFNNDPSSSGAFAGLGIQFLFDRHFPIVALSRKDGKVHVSSRGTRELVDLGLNLSTAMRDAGSRVGGNGGGHPIASGATIPDGREIEFLKIVDGIVAEQFKNNGKR